MPDSSGKGKGMTTVPRTVTTLPQAFRILGLQGRGISSQEDIYEAFRRKVKSSADGRGGYSLDMDDLTQAKEFLLSAFARHQEQARLNQARKRAREQEQKEREQAKKRAREQAEAKQRPKKVEPLRLGPASFHHQVKQAFEQKHFWNCELARYYRSLKREGNMETIQMALSLLESKKFELEQIRKREQDILQELSRIQTKRAELEKAVQTASSLADQMLAILK